jgi:hypothetical protein
MTTQTINSEDDMTTTQLQTARDEISSAQRGSHPDPLLAKIDALLSGDESQRSEVEAELDRLDREAASYA